MKKIPIGEFGYKLTSYGGGIHHCPVCDQPTMFVNLADESNVTFECGNGCSQFQILDALGQEPDAIVYVGIGSATPTPSEPEKITEEKAKEWLAMLGVSSFLEFARLCKKANNNSLPPTWEGVKVDAMAAALGYKITADRLSAYMIPQTASAANLLQRKLTLPPFAVDKILPAGFCTFSAPPKSYKSWMVLDLCDSVANGSPFLGYDTHKGDVLYLDLEGSDYNLQDRMKKMKCRSADNFHFAFEAPLLGQGLLDFFEDWCASVQTPRLIVIDVLQKVKPRGSARLNAYENDYAIYGPLNTFAISKGIAIVGVTHNRKSNGMDGDDFERISGSVGQMASAQTSWVISGKRGISQEKRFKALGRNVTEIDDVIHFDLSAWRWINEGNAEAAAQREAEQTYARNPIRRTLIELLSSDSSCTWYGTYNDLFQEIANRTGEYPFESGKALAIGIRPLLRLLAANDGIHKMSDTNKKNGEYYHKWHRKNMVEE